MSETEGEPGEMKCEGHASLAGNHGDASDTRKVPLEGMALLFEDPITLELMDNATIAKCGHTFSASTIRPYVETHGKCPICSHGLSTGDLATDYKLNEAIQQYHIFLKQEGSAQSSNPIEEDITSLTIPLVVSTEELNRQINPNYKSPLDDYKLIIDILTASDLANQQRRGTSCPYCIIQFGNRKQRTSVAKNTLSPEWRECFIFDVREDHKEDDDDIRLVKYEDHPSLIIDVWDSCKIGKDKFMGRATVPWDEISQHKNQIVKSRHHLKFHNFEEEKRKTRQKKGEGKWKGKGKGKESDAKKNKTKHKTKNSAISGSVKLRICYANLRKLRAAENSTQTRAPRASFILKVVEEGDSIASRPDPPVENDGGASLPPPAEERNPYDVQCPYDNCGSWMACYLFPAHANTQHANDANQRFGCPVCQFVMGSQYNYAVTEQTNLLGHLRQQHASDLNVNS